MHTLIAIDSVDVLLSKQRNNAMFVYDARSGNAPLYQASIDKKQVREVNLSKPQQLAHDEELALKLKEIRHELSQQNGKWFYLSYYSGKNLENNLARLGLNLFGNTWKTQSYFEDKVTFQQFCNRYRLTTPPHRILQEQFRARRKPQTVGFKDRRGTEQETNLHGGPSSRKPWVVQERWIPEDGPGTYKVASPTDLDAAIRKLRGRGNLLCRAYVKGVPIGITLLVGRSKIVCSAVRAQVSTPFQRGDYLIGTQWLPSRALSRSQLNGIEDAINPLAYALQSSGYTGVANIDLILQDNKALIIECNARSTTSSYLLSSRSELLGGLDYLSELEKIYSKGDPSKHNLKIPHAEFAGTSLELDTFNTLSQFKTIKFREDMSHAGIYSYKGKQKEQKKAPLLSGYNVEGFSEKKEALLIMSPAPRGVPLSSSWSLGSAISTFPLFRLENSQMTIKEHGVIDWLKHHLFRSLEVAFLSNTQV